MTQGLHSSDRDRGAIHKGGEAGKLCLLSVGLRGRQQGLACTQSPQENWALLLLPAYWRVWRQPGRQAATNHAYQPQSPSWSRAESARWGPEYRPRAYNRSDVGRDGLWLRRGSWQSALDDRRRASASVHTCVGQTRSVPDDSPPQGQVAGMSPTLSLAHLSDVVFAQGRLPFRGPQ